MCVWSNLMQVIWVHSIKVRYRSRPKKSEGHNGNASTQEIEIVA
jgi:hypothetical protein